jgi:hypothetical protein
MTHVRATLVILVSAAGLVAGAVVAATARDGRAGIAVMLDLWTAAGLLRLNEDVAWASLGTAALLVALRKMVTLVGLRRRPA